MRNLSSTTLALLAQRTGTRPVTVLEVEWTDANFFDPDIYADASYPGAGTNGRDVEGRILNLAVFDDALNFAKSNATQSVSVTLADTDGKLKAKFDNADLHKRPCALFQWFEGIPYAERFLLFKGVIASPIRWDEAKRTLSFTILSRVEDREVGFSPEDGLFPVIPQGMIGKAWPLVFGTACFVPTVLCDQIPHGNKTGSAADSVLAEPVGIHDPSLDKQIENNELTSAAYIALAKIDFIGYLEASSAARRNGELGPLDPIEKGNGPFSQQARALLAAGNELLHKAGEINQKNSKLKEVRRNQKAYEKGTLTITNGSNFPQNTPITLEINGAAVSGYFSGDTFVVQGFNHPDAELTEGLVVDPLDKRVGEPVITRNTFFFADAGTPLQYNATITGAALDELLANPPPQPARYIVACQTPVTISAAYAYRTVNNYKSIYPIPADYFQVVPVDFGDIQATVLYFPQPLSSLGQGWEDEVWATCVSSVGPNPVDVMRYFIDNYTIYDIDDTSFDAVRPQLDPFPFNFALLDRPNVIQLLQKLAYLCRCVVYLKNDTFYIKNLAYEDTPVDTITKDDILFGSLAIEGTPTEDLSTKYTANWQADYLNRQKLKFILRYNIEHYGLHDKTEDYFTYNTQGLVARVATFWTIREANSFKLVKFKTPISKLNIETLDTVTLDLPEVASSPINGLVESAAFDSNDFTIDFTVWVPVRLGEMTLYDFAYPGNLTTQQVWPTENDIDTFRATAVGADYNNSTGPITEDPFTGDSGNGFVAPSVTIGPHRPLSWGNPETSDTLAGPSTPVIVTKVDSTAIKPTQKPGQKPSGTTSYQYDMPKAPTTTTPATTGGNSTFPGFITAANGDGSYLVDVFEKGTDNTATQNVTAFAVDIDTTDGDLAIDTPVMVTKVQFIDPTDGQTQVTQWYFAAPVWN